MGRLDQERQSELEPRRLEVAKLKIELLGYDVTGTKVMLEFVFNGHNITYYPYSGWATGKSIKDGRGLQHLLNQIKIK